MIHQHFIRSPSVRQKLQDRYAGLELLSGILIAVTIVLIIFLLSSMNGSFVFIILLVLVISLLFFGALAYWAYEQKRKIHNSAISGPLTQNELNIMGIQYRNIDYSNSSQPQPFPTQNSDFSKYYSNSYIITTETKDEFRN